LSSAGRRAAPRSEQGRAEMGGSSDNQARSIAALDGPAWALLIASALTLVLAALASIWRFLAAQSPSSPIHLGPLVGPIDNLATGCWIAGVAGLALAALWPRLGLARGPSRRIVVLFVGGWTVLLAGLILGAALGTTGTQVIKAYPRTVTVLMIKLVGFFALLVGLVRLAAAALTGRRRADRRD
jgi:hypothetical protein